MSNVTTFKFNDLPVRIVEKDGDTFITQGDANNAPDLRPVERNQVLGRVTGTLPDVGWFILWLHGY